MKLYSYQRRVLTYILRRARTAWEHFFSWRKIMKVNMMTRRARSLYCRRVIPVRIVLAQRRIHNYVWARDL